MRKTIILLLLLLPAMAFAQSAAVEFLDKAVAAMKADAAVQMDYSSTVYDENGKAVQTDKGVMRLDGNRYSLLMDEMKVWCNGKVQWSYMSSVNEIYITDAASDEAQNMSPLYIMEKFRDGFAASMEKKGNATDIVLESAGGDDNINKVLLRFGNGGRLELMCIYMAGQGRIEVLLDEYTAHCSFPDSVYECPVEDFPSAEVVDMR
ncbi:MAG: hypothetical protein J6R07_04885 [Bacteroidaceae bacterium]|nr:hypothetical protein [Bacteroidaceae bacterium]